MLVRATKQRTRSVLTSPVQYRTFLNQYWNKGHDEKYGKPRLVPPVFNIGFLTIVGQEYAVMIHRLGKFNRVLKPGLNFKIPFIEKIDTVHDMREWVIEILPQVGTTKDNVQITSDAYLYIQIVDPEKASYAVEDNIQAIMELA